MGLKARKPVFGVLRITQAQTSLRICAVWSAPLLFAFWKVQYVTCYRWNFNLLANLCSWGDWFETHFVGNPKDRFYPDEAHIWVCTISHSRKKNFCFVSQYGKDGTKSLSTLQILAFINKRALGPWIAHLNSSTWVDDVSVCGYRDIIYGYFYF